MTRFLVCGSRDFNDRELMEQVFLFWAIGPGSTVIQGGARGADIMAARIAVERKADVDVYLADWKHEGRGAGFIRNRRMLEEGHPDVVLAFYAGRHTNGTDDTVRRATKMGLPVYQYGLSE